jgi:hypothetical protein
MKDKTVKYKIPDQMAMVEDFPRTASEKVQKFKLREMAVQKMVLFTKETAEPPEGVCDHAEMIIRKNGIRFSSFSPQIGEGIWMR